MQLIVAKLQQRGGDFDSFKSPLLGGIYLHYNIPIEVNTNRQSVHFLRERSTEADVGNPQQFDFVDLSLTNGLKDKD